MDLTTLYDRHFDSVYRFIHHAAGEERAMPLAERVWSQVAYDPKPSTLYRAAVAAVYHLRSADPPIPLPADNLQRLAVLLRFAANLTPAQIAVALDISTSHALNLLQEGLTAIARKTRTEAG
jgi:hypothetical protein